MSDTAAPQPQLVQQALPAVRPVYVSFSAEINALTSESLIAVLARLANEGQQEQNLTMRMSMRRFTRLTNGFSKKVENHVAMLALHYMHYNFVRIHKTLRVTPAMEAGIVDHVWSIEEIVGLLG